jgi:hypothetical protein
MVVGAFDAHLSDRGHQQLLSPSGVAGLRTALAAQRWTDVVAVVGVQCRFDDPCRPNERAAASGGLERFEIVPIVRLAVQDARDQRFQFGFDFLRE